MSGNTRPPHPQSPLLDHCPPGLPAYAYFDPDWFRREQDKIWGRTWVYAGRRTDFAANTIHRLTIGGQSVIVLRNDKDMLTAYHNTCRHRGAELCRSARQPFNGRLITCPYHAWAYDMAGKLVSTAFATPTADFDRGEHRLFPVHLMDWNGFIYLCLADDTPAFQPDMGLAAYDNWPMSDLVTGHKVETDLACNWKVFWENYNECLHCPSIHPELSDRVPVYQQGIMSAQEAADWTPSSPASPILKEGASTWTVNGQPCGPEFTGLTDAERSAGHSFVTLYPSSFVVAHTDYVRVVSLTPLDAETTRLRAEWLFLPQTLSAPGFDLANVVDFAKTVLRQDGAACEMNQRGLKSSRFSHARLMPQEFDIHNFHNWVLDQLERPD